MTTPNHRYPVWAPRADRVRLQLDGDIVAMKPVGNGWWEADPTHMTPAQADHSAFHDYGFLLDDDDHPLPDPRGRRLVDGVHGLSRTTTADTHRWADTGWTGRPLGGGVIYEMHIGTFSPAGTFAGAIEKLDHLVDLGVDFVELLPVNAFNGTHNWGYDGVAWFAVHEHYGGPAGYRRFVEACHARGLAVIQDVVYNHLGPSGNYLPRFGPYVHDERANTWGSSVNLDGPDSDEVRRYILDNVAMWFTEYHVDGLRLDAVHALHDTRATHLLEEMASEVAALSVHLGRPLTLIAESDMNDARLVTERTAGGTGLHAAWNDDFHHAVHVALTGETAGYYEDFAPFDTLTSVLTRVYLHDGSYSSFRGRHHGRPVDTSRIPADRFVVSVQTHDQIGNRAVGDRLSAQLDDTGLRIAAVLLLTSPFTPMLFMGEEWGARTPWQFFTSHPEPDLGRATAEGRIAEFARMGWDPEVVPDPQQVSTFTDSKLDWAEPDAPGHADLLDFYRSLIRLRRDHPDLTDPRLDRIRVGSHADTRTLVVHRDRITVLVHLGDEPVRLQVGPDQRRILIATDPGIGVADGTVVLPRRGAVVLGPA